MRVKFDPLEDLQRDIRTSRRVSVWAAIGVLLYLTGILYALSMNNGRSAAVLTFGAIGLVFLMMSSHSKARCLREALQRLPRPKDDPPYYKKPFGLNGVVQ